MCFPSKCTLVMLEKPSTIIQFQKSLESRTNDILLDLAALRGKECRFHCRIYTLKLVSKSSHTTLRGIFWSATWNKNITNTAVSTSCSQAEILTTSYRRWAASSGYNPTRSQYQETYSIYQSDATPIWVTLHFDLFQSCWHSEAPLCIVPHKLRRRKEQRGGWWVGRKSRNLRMGRSKDELNQKMGCRCF